MAGKYDHIDFSVPESVRAAARRGLELRRSQSKSRKAGLDTRQAAKQGIGSGVARASSLASGKKISPETARRMKAYFDRHASNYKLDAGKKPHEDKGYVAGLLWGGDAGRAFANKLVRQMEAADKKAKKALTMPGPIEMFESLYGPIDNWSRAGVLDAIAKATGIDASSAYELGQTIRRPGAVTALQSAAETAVAYALEDRPRFDGLVKAVRSHKYLRKVPTGNPKKPWRYYYRTKSGKVIESDEKPASGEDNQLSLFDWQPAPPEKDPLADMRQRAADYKAEIDAFLSPERGVEEMEKWWSLDFSDYSGYRHLNEDLVKDNGDYNLPVDIGLSAVVYLGDPPPSQKEFVDSFVAYRRAQTKRLIEMAMKESGFRAREVRKAFRTSYVSFNPIAGGDFHPPSEDAPPDKKRFVRAARAFLNDVKAAVEKRKFGSAEGPKQLSFRITDRLIKSINEELRDVHNDLIDKQKLVLGNLQTRLGHWGAARDTNEVAYFTSIMGDHGRFRPINKDMELQTEKQMKGLKERMDLDDIDVKSAKSRYVYAQKAMAEFPRDDYPEVFRGMGVSTDVIASLKEGQTIPLTGCTAFAFDRDTAYHYSKSAWTQRHTQTTTGSFAPILIELERDETFDLTVAGWHHDQDDRYGQLPAFEIVSGANAIEVTSVLQPPMEMLDSPKRLSGSLAEAYGKNPKMQILGSGDYLPDLGHRTFVRVFPDKPGVEKHIVSLVSDKIIDSSTRLEDLEINVVGWREFMSNPEEIRARGPFIVSDEATQIPLAQARRMVGKPLPPDPTEIPTIIKARAVLEDPDAVVKAMKPAARTSSFKQTVLGFNRAMAEQPMNQADFVEKANFSGLVKAVRSHKYLRKVPTGNPKRPWRYIYSDEKELKEAPLLTGADGLPLRLYVGTAHEGELRPEGGHEYGIYLTPRRKYAQLWARETGGRLREFTARASNPLFVENKGEISPKDLTKQDIDKLRAQGYDAIVSTSSTLERATEVVLFDASQLQPKKEPSDGLIKAARGHKYIRRESTGNPKRPWRYIYKEAESPSGQSSVSIAELDSPLTYYRSSDVKRLEHRDASVTEPPNKNDTFFAGKQEMEYYSKRGKRLKKPRKGEYTPGVSDDSVTGFLDYHKTFKDDYYIDYMRTREGFTGQGIAMKLIEELIERKKPKTLHFGKVMNATMMRAVDRVKEKYPNINVLAARNF